jgi:outer membrane protein, heavy metal efflux system
MMKVFCMMFLLIGPVCAFAQMLPAPSLPIPLATLLAEAQQQNPEIQVSLHGAQAAGHAAKQAGALPDTQVMLQHLSVGSPRPFAGYSNSDFAYIGVGVTQEFPYPGKRALRTQIAEAQAGVMSTQTGAVSRMVIEQVKMAYFKLAYLQATLGILQRDDKLLVEMEQTAESRYRVGMGNQQEVLKAQLQHTRILQEINLHHREQGQLQAQLKQLLGRAQDSPDIVTETLRERAVPASATELLQQVRQNNPEINAREQLIKRADLQTDLARKDFRPDFALQYVYQNTDRKFRDYYMMTFTVTLPNRGRKRAELAEARENRQTAAAEFATEVQKRMAEVQDQYVIARTSAEQLRIFREGLLPQAEATFRAAITAYQANRQDFETLLSSFRDVLDFEEQYQKELSEHESALARLESLTGVTLP